MRKILSLTAIALALAACATPQERCISGARSEQANISAQIGIIEGNIARGYAIHRQNVPYTFIGTCYDNTRTRYSCEKNATRIVETPVAIDIAEERRKLAPLKGRLMAVQARMDANVAQCRAQFPE